MDFYNFKEVILWKICLIFEIGRQFEKYQRFQKSRFWLNFFLIRPKAKKCAFMKKLIKR